MKPYFCHEALAYLGRERNGELRRSESRDRDVRTRAQNTLRSDEGLERRVSKLSSFFENLLPYLSTNFDAARVIRSGLLDLE